MNAALKKYLDARIAPELQGNYSEAVGFIKGGFTAGYKAGLAAGRKTRASIGARPSSLRGRPKTKFT